MNCANPGRLLTIYTVKRVKAESIRNGILGNKKKIKKYGAVEKIP